MAMVLLTFGNGAQVLVHERRIARSHCLHLPAFGPLTYVLRGLHNARCPYRQVEIRGDR